eukprot:TRINITY_DN43079_c0_g1_i1.p1 TRINITY_DN43079_c0_g1~~TRINITY_DN43079_c0_g1_i1.p1  ORF type:complete len:458 (-),score=77.69 TRINITY_DN43079_c0_g1_i1:231-1580(-)
MDNYLFVRKIGKGSFGEAVLVRSKMDGNRYVAKEIQLEKLNEKDRRDALNEVKILAKLNHPNITKYVESFQVKETLFIIMEYADGGDLHTVIRAQRKKKTEDGTQIWLPEQQVLHWFSQLCLAIKYLHERRVMHRDLKAQNVFLTRANVVKLGDFGIARVMQNTLAMAHTICGTPYYFSPEICQNKPYNSKSDIWALGCILYELCTLRHAFDATDVKQLVQRILKGVYPSVEAPFSPELKALVTALLQQEQDERPSINEILAQPLVRTELRSLADKLTEEVPPSPAAQPPTPPAAVPVASPPAAPAPLTKTLSGVRPAKPHKVAPGSGTEAVPHFREERQIQAMSKADPKAFMQFLKGPPPPEVAAVLDRAPSSPHGRGPEPDTEEVVEWAGVSMRVHHEDDACGEPAGLKRQHDFASIVTDIGTLLGRDPHERLKELDCFDESATPDV